MTQVGDVREIFITQRANIRTLPTHFTLRWSQQSAQNAQQASLATSIRSGELNKGSGRQFKIETPEESAIPTYAAEFTDL